MAGTRLLTVRIASDKDVVFVRQRARDLAALLGFDERQQTFVATAVSEIVRNAQRYAGGGSALFSVEGDAPQALVITVRDTGKGIANLDDVLAGQYTSQTGMGMGLVGARRLMDDLRVESAPGRGTEVVMTKFLPPQTPKITAERASALAAELARYTTSEPIVELQHQNHELLLLTTELRAKQDDLERLNAELEATNRGVLALYAELDEKAESLRRASESKTRFLSNMTHEFRTPLNSILGLTSLLLERSDGDLTSEQERQVSFIRRSAEDLTGIVNDLLDIAKVEAGRIEVQPSEFTAAELLAALKGVCRPLIRSESVTLIFDEPPPITLYSDETKISQILRNFVSNALKYTESGEVRVTAEADAEGTVAFSVTDTGIGIAPRDHDRIFEEFTQIEGPIQRRVKGTGLGLPLTRRLAGLLGGRVAVDSDVGRGSTFTLVVPAHHPIVADPSVPSGVGGRRTRPVLVVDSSLEALEAYAIWLEGTQFHLVPASTVEQARRAIEGERPAAVIIDVVMQGESGWVFLENLTSSPQTQEIPVLVVTIVENRERALELGAVDFARKPVDRAWLVERLRTIARPRRAGPVLVVDDDEVARYLLDELLEGTGLELVHAASGAEGLRAARERRPAAIVLDLVMPEMSGEDVLDELERDPAMRDIPVVIYTSEEMSRERRASLDRRVEAIVIKRMRERDAMREQVLEALERCGVTSDGGATTDG